MSYRLIILFLLVLDFALLLANLLWGSVRMSWVELWAALWGGSNATHEAIIWRLRLPNALMAVGAGGGLAVSGLLMQTFFRNPIASPYLLGVSAGASFGVALGMLIFGTLSVWSVIILGAGGALAVLALLLAAAMRLRQNNGLLILGLMLGSIVGALIELMQYFAQAEALQRFAIWSQGSLQGSRMAEAFWLVPLIFLTSVWAFWSAKGLNALLLGEAYAQSMGLNINHLRYKILTASALLAGSVTAFCGPIGFVGIVAPHAARWLLRTADHRRLLPTSFLIGCALLLSAGLLSVLVSQQRPLPLNALTALLGVPIVLWLVLRGRQIS